jgi:protein TonB
VTGLVPFFLASVALHLGLFLFCGAMMLSSPHLVGVDGRDENRIYVTVVSQEEQTAQDELPAPKDSAPSMPRQADKTKADERTEKPENELHEPEGVEKPEATQEENSEDMPILASSVPDPIRDRIRTEAGSTSPSDGTRDSEEEHREHELVESAKRPEENQKRAHEPRSGSNLARVASVRSRFRAAEGKALADFNAQVQAAIKEATHFPQDAAPHGIHGTTKVKFIVDRDGSLLDVKVIRPSGEELLDSAALKIVRTAARKFPRIPATITRDRLSYVVPIVFKKKKPRKK